MPRQMRRTQRVEPDGISVFKRKKFKRKEEGGRADINLNIVEIPYQEHKRLDTNMVSLWFYIASDQDRQIPHKGSGIDRSGFNFIFI